MFTSASTFAAPVTDISVDNPQLTAMEDDVGDMDYDVHDDGEDIEDDNYDDSY